MINFTFPIFCFSEDFDKMFHGENIELKPCLQVYQVTCRFLIVWKKDRDKERFSKLCRYILFILNYSSCLL